MERSYNLCSERNKNKKIGEEDQFERNIIFYQKKKKGTKFFVLSDKYGNFYSKRKVK